MTAARNTAAGMLLVHGAWQGSWAWDAWLPELAARGWPAHAVDLPGNGADPQRDAAHPAVSLQTYVDALQAGLAAFDGPAVVVAHSGAGVPVSQLAEALPDKVACIVYVAGMMLPSGLGYADFVEASAADVPGAEGIAPYLLWSDDRATTEVPPQAALDVFLHDCPPDAARRAAAKLTPQRESGRALVATLTDERFGRVPRIYVEALRDRSVLLPLQRRMQALVPGALVRSIDCGHVPQLARPAELADLVGDALARLGIVAPSTLSSTTGTLS
ncbi:alpha/beta fold hydrolase [Paraburkholderia caballeronis]|uniref:Pimeloyl-ACP methyl ester carboxylesterase n=1 Tax=Paraburkholderia caballeronis TaxID=416943 RepID=A0A1H7RQM2_9BURK|nr:alpha/beta hydrolase [Paraburkholderia caballeronis]PXW23161.1 pimeloyl-ACP methyl ester carboxylesterase [Paraburkholderia caballeronis]PXW97825.1 pimeloyl-ACP methyl ester carboxylesterase [Paraburkholderia caballeronis]RAJ94795.1 pimeloyl-ACP methyl ester carboxylesterase [Paraburkholderia caballeronis]SEE62219.1 Pimeloyl-ACP methyl ester carboxylesterase [Paraburkholderia caballeronis]SEL62511.1 Pimeloyl-ACP methyl ester carboxylesterase [Paraburkholderia caballeronis]